MKRTILGIIMTAMVLSLPAQIFKSRIIIQFLSLTLFSLMEVITGLPDMIPGQPVMLVYFDPDCEHCEDFIKTC